MSRSAKYHHGDLRKALVDAADGMLREGGVDGVSLRGIARIAGVSHAAPYHHFKDLNSLLGAVATAGFVRLRNEMLDGAGKPRPDPLGRLQEAGVAYVGFAAANPELYRLMFSARLREQRGSPELSSASTAAYETLGDLLRDAVSPREDPESRLDESARAAWATVHGLAMLLIDDRLDVALDDRKQVEELVRSVTRVLGRGLRNTG